VPDAGAVARRVVERRPAGRVEGIYLDPTYSGRAMAALSENSFPRGERVVFLHSGGLPGLFGHPQV
jgi:L-cysteate sulfo-lyase